VTGRIVTAKKEQMRKVQWAGNISVMWWIWCESDQVPKCFAKYVVHRSTIVSMCYFHHM